MDLDDTPHRLTASRVPTIFSVSYTALVGLIGAVNRVLQRLYSAFYSFTAFFGAFTALFTAPVLGVSDLQRLTLPLQRLYSAFTALLQRQNLQHFLQQFSVHLQQLYSALVAHLTFTALFTAFQTWAL